MKNVSSLSDQVKNILTGILLFGAIVLVISLIGYIISILRGTELSDQVGWKTFRNPIIGISFFVIAILGIILVVLILLGVL